MNRRPNRIVLTLTGVVLVAAGTTALLAAGGVVALQQPAQLHDRLTASVAANPEAWTAGVVVGGFLVAAMGFWLVRRQVTAGAGHRLGTLTLRRGPQGRTTLEAAAAARAAATDLRARRGVVGTGVQMVAFGPRPRLRVSLAVNADTEPRVALDRAEEVYERMRRVLGTEAIHVDTTVRPTGEPSARVS